MKKGDFRGRHSIEISKKNKEDVFRYLKLFPTATQMECAKHLKLSLPTVSKYRKMFFEEEKGQ